MAASVATSWIVEPPDVSHVVTEDDQPVDNFLSEKQQRLLVETLYAGWEGPRSEEGEPRTFVAASNVGLFATPRSEPLVPDVFVSLDVAVHEDIWAKEHRTYFFWEMGKPPDVAVEIVSNKEGGEADRKLRGYARMRIPYCVIHDPGHHLGQMTLRTFELRGDLYIGVDPIFPALGLKLGEWAGTFEGLHRTWLRWFRLDGALVPTGAERAETEKRRAETEKQRADRLAARLRALGIDPDEG
jgi:Uma2 family endonuclease